MIKDGKKINPMNVSSEPRFNEFALEQFDRMMSSHSQKGAC